jgi:hypothetical protein
VVDGGSSHPAPGAAKPALVLAWAPPGAAPEPGRESAREQLEALERELSRVSEELGTAHAMLSVLGASPRWYRQGRLPVVGRQAVERLLGEEEAPLSWEPLRADAAESGDLGYTYGPYLRSGENGHYIHVWRRQAEGRWTLVAEVLIPLPKPPAGEGE